MFTLPLNAQDLLAILPHRYPFLLVDSIEKITLGKKSPEGDKIIGYKYVSYNEHFFQGHFPDHPIMPGVLIIEALAQTALVLALKYQGDSGKRYHAYFTGIDAAKFRKPVFPGSLLRLEYEVLKEASMKKFWMGKVQAFLVKNKSDTAEGELVCEAKLSSALVSKEEK